MTPREVLTEIEGLGYRLALRPGGLRLTGATQPPPTVLAKIREHRGALMEVLESWDRAQAAHNMSLGTDRVTTFPAHLLEWVHPSIRGLLALTN